MNFLASGPGVEYPRGTLYQVTRQVESVLMQPIQVCRFFTTFDRVSTDQCTNNPGH